MPSTTNFGWTTPADTDYVKDGASAIRTLAGGIDTSMAQLKGGTTGQILSKTNGTDMAFTWINNDQGDITAVTAGTGLSGGGTSGAVTVSIDTATTVDKTTAQTLTNKTLTAPVISTISNTGTLTLPTSTDTLVGRATTDTLTNKTISATSNTLTGVINNTLTTTTGDLIYASSANTPARLAIGSSNQILTVSGGVPTWATPAAAASGMTFINRTTFSNVAGQNIDSIFSSTYKSYLVIFEYFYSGDGTDDIYLQVRAGSTTITSNYYGCAMRINSAGTQTNYATSAANQFYLSDRSGTAANPSSYALRFQRVGNTAEKPIWHGTGMNLETYGTQTAGGGNDSAANTITGIRVSAATTNIYGVITTYGLATA